MKNILFLTDFSDTANNAARFAAWFAYNTQARLTLLHVLPGKTFFGNANSRSLKPEEAARIEQVKQKLEQSRDAVLAADSQYAAKLPIDFRTGDGPLAEVVESFCKEEGYNLVIMGTTGTRGDTLEDLMIGSNALNLFENLQVPVLAIPRKYKKRKLHRIVFATDFQRLDEAVMEETIKIGGSFQAHVHVLHVNKTESKTQDQRLIEFTRPFAQKYDHLHFNNIVNSDAEAGVLDFTEQFSADLLVLARKQYGFFEKIFSQSTTELVSGQTKVPMLVFPAAWKKNHIPVSA